MRSSRALGITAGTAAIAFATLVVAAPAAAATLPDGQKITIVQFLDSNDPNEGQFFDVKAADAASTPVGTPTDQTIVGIEVGDDGIGAAIGQLDSVSTIWVADANTGTVSSPKTISLNGQIELDECMGIDLVNGTFLLSCEQNGLPSKTHHIGAVDPATGTFTSFFAMMGVDYDFTSLATDPTTGQLWAFGTFTGVPSAFAVDLEADSLDDVQPMDDVINAADFDRDGQLFVSTETTVGNSTVPALAVTDPTTGVFTFIQPYLDTATDLPLAFVAALTVWGAAPPALAATGASPEESAPIAIGSALLLLAGAAFVATARLNRKTA